MSRSCNSVIVVFDENLGDSEVESITKAIGQFRHVITVTANDVDIGSLVGEARARNTFAKQLSDLISSWYKDTK